PTGDGTWDAGSSVSTNIPNLDITGSSISLPPASSCAGGIPCYRISMTLNDLSLASPDQTPEQDLVWLTQWLLPAGLACTTTGDACENGGANFFAYAESTFGGDATCYDGENAAQALGGGVALTYP